MAEIPAHTAQEFVLGLKLLSRGKVRDTYLLPGHPDKLLVIATDRISIFDFVLPAEVRNKGAVLTAMNIFWRKEVIGDLCPHDLVAYGDGIDEYLPENLRGDHELQKRAVVVEKLTMLPFEAIVRGYLTGSGFKAYKDTGEVCGHQLSEGLQDGSRLPHALFTPTTKADVGHDEHVDTKSITSEHGKDPEKFSLQLYALAHKAALVNGIVVPDTKFEWGFNSEGCITLGDEVLTPDSSRFWDKEDWERAIREGRTPNPFDKQHMRNWGKERGVHKRDPANPEDVAYVHGLEVPAEILKQTTQLYRYIFWRLTGQKLEAFQRDQMGIDAFPPYGPLQIDVVLGSRSDLKHVKSALSYLDALGKDWVAPRVNIISCHRNPEVLRSHAMNTQAEVIVAAAGKAAALPGMLASWLRYFGNRTPVIGVALEGGTEDADLAATLSIKELPGQPVLLDKDGRPFFGAEGLRKACEMAVKSEFLLTEAGVTKKAEFNLDIVELLKNLK